MHKSCLAMIRCPVSGTELKLTDALLDETSGHIITGNLVSPQGHRYVIRQGIPHLYTGYSSQAEAATVSSFGAEWARYNDFEGYMGSRDLFTMFTGLQEQEIANKNVLEIGCGGGRWLKVMADMGAKQIVGLDLGTSVEQALQRTHHLSNVHVIRGSALALPLAREFDLAVSIGVVHHLQDPVLALKSLRKVVRQDHLIAIWVYAKEGNELYLRAIRPFRWLGPKLNPFLLGCLSKALAGPVWLHMHTINKLAISAGIPLPLSQYFNMLSRLRFRDLDSVVYDQLTPSIARYPTKKEVCYWIEAAEGIVTRIHHRTGNSWQCHFRF
jgi:SAM-dependent methyltransferase